MVQAIESTRAGKSLSWTLGNARGTDSVYVQMTPSTEALGERSFAQNSLVGFPCYIAARSQAKEKLAAFETLVTAGRLTDAASTPNETGPIKCPNGSASRPGPQKNKGCSPASTSREAYAASGAACGYLHGNHSGQPQQQRYGDRQAQNFGARDHQSSHTFKGGPQALPGRGAQSSGQFGQRGGTPYAPPAPQAPRLAEQQCFDSVKGKCTRGDSCRYPHVPLSV